MTYRVLCDENVEPKTVGYLEKSGHDAVHINDEPGQSADDSEVAAYARQHEFVILTNDSDFLDEEKYSDVKVLYFPNNRESAYDLAGMVARATTYFPTQESLPRDLTLSDDYKE